MKSILVAGLGNSSRGDEAFGCEVVRQLEHLKLVGEVDVVDFGRRSSDLASALTNGYSTAILVDVMSRGRPPGTLCLLEPDVRRLNPPKTTELGPNTEPPASVFQMARSLGDVCPRMFLLGCEPAMRKSVSDESRLSEEVEQAVFRALATVELLVEDLLQSKPKVEEQRVAA